MARDGSNVTRRPARIALTGGIATGKSHVREQFEALGVATIDSDVLARAAVAPGTPGLAAVVQRFGPGILDANGALDRRQLATIVFADADARLDLEHIVHPAVREATEAWFGGLDPGEHAFAIADIPLLYEVGRDRDFDLVIVAAAPPELQIERVMRRNQISDSDARLRLAAQLPIDEKVRRADLVIRTDGSVDDTNRQIAELCRRLRETIPVCRLS
jgi:dephospho-CoA kinase